jgi:hypothetical protein
MSYNSFVLLPAAASIDLEKLEAAMNSYFAGKPGMAIARTHQQGYHSIVVSNYGWKTFLNINTEGFVNEESKEIAEHTRANADQKKILERSTSRIEIATDNDPAMQYFNDHILLLQHFETTTGGVLFDCNTGELI